MQSPYITLGDIYQGVIVQKLMCKDCTTLIEINLGWNGTHLKPQLGVLFPATDATYFDTGEMVGVMFTGPTVRLLKLPPDMPAENDFMFP